MALAVLLAPGTSAAQANYRLAPVGGRTTLVGGTGLAYGRDSASAFLNPATIVRVDPGRLAFSVNVYSLSLITANNWYQPGEVDRRFGDITPESSSIANYDFDGLPGSLCVFLRASDIGFLARGDRKDLKERQARLGICLASVQVSTYSFNGEDYNQGGAFGQTRQAGNIRQTFRRFAVGPSYAMYVDDHVAIGTSLHFSRASFRSIIGNTAFTQVNGRDAPFSSVFYKTSRGDSHELTLAFGATYRLGHQTWAATIEAPSLHLFGSGGTNLYTHSEGPDGMATANSSAQGSFTANTPLRVAFGTGYEAPWGSAELNVSVHAPMTRAYKASFSGNAYDSRTGAQEIPELALATRARGTVNIGVGGEYFLSPKISLLGGLSTDFSAVPNGALAQDQFNYFPSQTHRVSTSFGYGSHGDGGDLLLGGEFSYGWGERLAVNPYVLPARLETADERQYVLLLVLAGSTSFKAIKRAVDDATKALDPSKTAPTKKEPPRETEPMKTDKQTEGPKPTPATDPAQSEAPAAEPPKAPVPPRREPPKMQTPKKPAPPVKLAPPVKPAPKVAPAKP